MTGAALIGAEPPWSGPGRPNGLPECRRYVYRGNKPLTPAQRDQVELGLAQLAGQPRRGLAHSNKHGWSSTRDEG